MYLFVIENSLGCTVIILKLIGDFNYRLYWCYLTTLHYI